MMKSLKLFLKIKKKIPIEILKNKLKIKSNFVFKQNTKTNFIDNF